ncbi:MAG: hypothetical protein AVDCRST_MAG09-2257, partial [uncultured Sphingomonas sp.]
CATNSTTATTSWAGPNSTTASTGCSPAWPTGCASPSRPSTGWSGRRRGRSGAGTARGWR